MKKFGLLFGLFLLGVSALLLFQLIYNSSFFPIRPVSLQLLLYSGLPAYFIGSIPTGFVLAKLVGLGDIRNIGSGNIGATNMVRAGGKTLGAVVLLIDAIKGAIGFTWSIFAVGLIAYEHSDADLNLYALITCLICILGVFIGHMFPVWLNFKGGKGISIMLGSLLGLSFTEAFGFMPLGVFLITWVACYLLTRTSSLSGLSATLTVVGYFYLAYCLNRAAANSASPTYVFQYLSMTVVYFFAALLVFYRHKDNIRRLLRGEELGFRRKEKVSFSPSGTGDSSGGTS